MLAGYSLQQTFRGSFAKCQDILIDGTQLTFTCLKSTIETLEKGVE